MCVGSLLAEPVQFVAIRRTQGESLGNAGSYTTLELTSFPYGNQQISPFGDLRLHYFDDHHFASNLGMGFRFLSDCSSFAVGANAYYDYRRSSQTDFNQLGLGLDFLSQRWNLRLNGYLPVGKKRKLLSHCHFNYSGGYFTDRKIDIGSLGGANLEIERLFFQSSPIDIYMALGGYYYHHGLECKHHGNIFGIEYRLSINTHRPISLSLSVVHDPYFQTKVFGQLTWNFPVKCSEQEKMLFQPIQRYDMIVTDRKCRWNYNY